MDGWMDGSPTSPGREGQVWVPCGCEVPPLLTVPRRPPGHPLELPQEAAGEEQARGVLPQPLPDLPGVRRQLAAEGALRLPQRGRRQQQEREWPGRWPWAVALRLPGRQVQVPGSGASSDLTPPCPGSPLRCKGTSAVPATLVPAGGSEDHL